MVVQTDDGIIRVTHEQKIVLEHLGKRDPEHVLTVEGLAKRPTTSYQRLRGQHGQSQCSTCGKQHDGVVILGEWDAISMEGLAMSVGIVLKGKSRYVSLQSSGT